jgi:hypothetical protein
MIAAFRRRIRRKVQKRRIVFVIPIPALMVDESAVIRFELGPKSSIGVDIRRIAFLVHQVVLAFMDIIAT